MNTAKFLRVILITLLFLIYNFKNIQAIENKILFKIDNDIITTIDIYEEIKFLKAFNPQINNLSDKELFEISKNSIIRNKIKKIEISKYVDEIKPYNIEQDLLDILKSDDPKIDVRFLGDDYKTKVGYTGCELGIDVHFIPRGHGWSATLLSKKIMDTRSKKWSDSQVQGWFDCCYSPSSKTQDKTRRT